MITTKSLRIDYENVNAVKDLHLDIKAGQIYGLVGPNGAGKTSTIKALAGILEPTYGEIHIDGIDLELNPEQALGRIGYMPDFPPVYENLQVWEYLDVFAAAYLLPREERMKRVKHWVNRVNLDDKWSSLIKTLSRGMRQRLVLAKTLLHEPKVLLLDEPASGLDPIARKEMRDVLKSVANENRAIIISSHILTELSDFCNAVGIMEKGNMVVSGDINEIRAHIGAKGILTIRLARSSDEATHQIKNILSDSENIQDPKIITNSEFQATLMGNHEDAAALLAQLVKIKIPVSEFFIREDNVEDIFFKIGAQEVS